MKHDYRGRIDKIKHERRLCIHQRSFLISLVIISLQRTKGKDMRQEKGMTSDLEKSRLGPWPSLSVLLSLSHFYLSFTVKWCSLQRPKGREIKAGIPLARQPERDTRRLIFFHGCRESDKDEESKKTTLKARGIFFLALYSSRGLKIWYHDFLPISRNFCHFPEKSKCTCVCDGSRQQQRPRFPPKDLSSLRLWQPSYSFHAKAGCSAPENGCKCAFFSNRNKKVKILRRQSFTRNTAKQEMLLSLSKNIWFLDVVGTFTFFRGESNKGQQIIERTHPKCFFGYITGPAISGFSFSTRHAKAHWGLACCLKPSHSRKKPSDENSKMKQVTKSRLSAVLAYP